MDAFLVSLLEGVTVVVVALSYGGRDLVVKGVVKGVGQSWLWWV